MGIFIPKAIAKLLAARAPSYKRASSPGFLQGHIQFADKEMALILSSSGAHTILVNASDIARTDPAAGSIKPEAGA